MQAFIDELKRNPALRASCKLMVKAKPNGSIQATPSNQAFTRFEQRLNAHKIFLEQVFNELALDMQHLRPDFGRNLALDGELLEICVPQPTKNK